MKNKILLESGTNEMELLVVEIDEQYFGINVAKVQSIQQYNPQLITSIPKIQKGILGTLFYREKNIPLVDLGIILGRKDPQNTHQQITVITEFNNIVNAFKVHNVNQIYRISWDKLIPMKGIMKKNSYITGSVLIDNHEILVLDLEYILAGLFPTLALENVDETVLNPKQSVSRDGLKIYFAEDSSIIRKGVMDALIRAGFENIMEFQNGKIAHDYFQTLKQNDDNDINNSVLISDIEMPEMDGLTLCKITKNDSDLENMRITMFSSLINTQMIEKCKSVGADNYVTKPK